MSDKTPAWFTRALAISPQDHVVDVAGARIHYLSWGLRRERGVERGFMSPPDIADYQERNKTFVALAA